jgi:hypothetical protein
MKRNEIESIDIWLARKDPMIHEEYIYSKKCDMQISYEVGKLGVTKITANDEDLCIKIYYDATQSIECYSKNYIVKYFIMYVENESNI